MLARLREFWPVRPDDALASTEAVAQVGVIPYALEDDVPVFLLVTSRRTGRWIFPKGVCRSGEAAEFCALREAYEEAGVEGEILTDPVGAYRDRKVAPGRAPVIEVRMFPLRVTRQHDDWPERKARRRHWATLEEARTLITTPGLLELAERAHARILASAGGGQGRKAHIQ